MPVVLGASAGPRDANRAPGKGSGLAARIASFALAAVIAASLASCGSQGSPPSPEEDYVSRFSHAVCDARGPCCQENGLPFDRGTCLLGSAGYVQSAVDRAHAAGAVFDAASGNACVEGARRLLAKCQDVGGDPATAAACSRVWSGKKRPGEACTDDLDCASASEGRGACRFTQTGTDGGTRSGVCVILRTPAAMGDVCGVPSGPPPRLLADCAPSLQCQLGSLTCQALTAIGEACPGFTQCAKGAYCHSSGTCAVQLASGAPCHTSAECANGACIHAACGHNAVGTPTPCNGSAP